MTNIFDLINSVCKKYDETYTLWYTVLSKECNIIMIWGYNLFEIAGQLELNLIID